MHQGKACEVCLHPRGHTASTGTSLVGTEGIPRLWTREEGVELNVAPLRVGNRLSYLSNILLCFSPTNITSIYLEWKCAQLKDYISQRPLQ